MATVCSNVAHSSGVSHYICAVSVNLTLPFSCFFHHICVDSCCDIVKSVEKGRVFQSGGVSYNILYI